MIARSQRELARIAAETSVHIASSSDSCQQSRDHVIASRRAIVRSLDLLSETAGKVGDDGPADAESSSHPLPTR